MGLRATDGESQSCEGERGSWRTTQSQNRVEQLTGLLPVGLGPSLIWGPKSAPGGKGHSIATPSGEVPGGGTRRF